MLKTETCSAPTSARSSVRPSPAKPASLSPSNKVLLITVNRIFWYNQLFAVFAVMVKSYQKFDSPSHSYDILGSPARLLGCCSGQVGLKV